MRELEVQLPDVGVAAIISLHEKTAPNASAAVWEALASPVETTTSHAAFDGEEVFIFIPPGEPVPLENQTMRPKPGEVMVFYSGPHDFVATRRHRTEPGETKFEVAFMYGETDLRHFYEEGLRGTLVGEISENLEAFAAACRETRRNGATRLILRRRQDGSENG